jgi:hypothetical protein
METAKKFGITWWEHVTMRTIGTLLLKKECHGICKKCSTKWSMRWLVLLWLIGPSSSHCTLKISWTQMTMFTTPILLVQKLKLLRGLKTFLCLRAQLLLMISIHFYIVAMNHVTMCSMSKTFLQHQILGMCNTQNLHALEWFAWWSFTSKSHHSWGSHQCNNK